MGRELYALLVVAACGSDKVTERAPTKGAPSKGAPLAATAMFRVDGPSPSQCAAPCDVQLVLTALGDYHVNVDYPFKFIADPSADVAIEGTGTFAAAGEKTGTLTIRVRPSKPGIAHITGVFKLSVCTPDQCEIEAPKIAFDVTSGG